MKIQDSPSAMTIGSVVKNNGYDHTHYLNISNYNSTKEMDQDRQDPPAQL